MAKYVLKRLLLLIPVLLGVSFVIFFILDITPGDPAAIILGEAATPEAIAQLNAELGLDKPFFARYLEYMRKLIFEQDMGVSYQNSRSVSAAVFERVPVSMKLALAGIAISALIGIPIGVLSAVKQYSPADTIPSLFALCLAAMPPFWLGMLLMFAFALVLGLLPSYGVGSWQHYVLPAISVGLPSAAATFRYTRSAMLDVIRQEYIVTARVKGASEWRIIHKHALKNALLPVITVLSLDFVSILGGSIATETLFSIPGIGLQLITSIRLKDVPMVMGGTLVLAFLCAIIVMVVDILYAFIDPRIKAKYARKG